MALNPREQAIQDALNSAKKFKEKSSIIDLGKEFVKPYGLDVQPSLERSPFAIHDAGHRYTNIPASQYGELLQNVADKAAFDKLYGSLAIEGSPLPYDEFKKGKAIFTNYGPVPDPQLFIQRPVLGSYEEALTKGITEQQKNLERVFGIAEEKLRSGPLAFIQGAGGYDPAYGFMPAPNLTNTREIAPEDVNRARVRGESYADQLLKGYTEAVQEGRYVPSYTPWKAQVRAEDLGEAAMRGELKIDRGWADEGIFPYRDRVAALSNPPARMESRDYTPERLEELANEARRLRAVDRLAGKLRTGVRGGLTIGAADLIPSREVIQDLYAGRGTQAATRMAGDIVSGIPTALAVTGGLIAAPALAPVATGIGGGLALVKAGNALDEVVRQQTGESTLQKFRQFVGTEPRTGIASPTPQNRPAATTADLTKSLNQFRAAGGTLSSNQPSSQYRAPAPSNAGVSQTGGYSTPQIRPLTAAQLKEMERQRRQSELERRLKLAGERFNPLKGEFGLSELLFGR